MTANAFERELAARANPGRTLFDLAGTLRRQRLERALDTCLSRGLVDTTGLRSQLDELA